MNYNLRESINANSILSKVEAIVSKTKIKHPRAEIIELDGTKYIYYSYFDRGFDDDGLDMVWDKCSDLKGVVDVGFGYGYGLENTKYEDSLLIELDDDVIVESKESARKSLKEEKEVWIIKSKDDLQYVGKKIFDVCEDIENARKFKSKFEAEEFLKKHDKALDYRYWKVINIVSESKESVRKSIKESKDITIEEFISDYKNNDCFSIRDKENGHESECFWGSKKDVLDSDYRLFTVLDTDVNKETDDIILYIDLEENAWVESKKSARKSIKESVEFSKEKDIYIAQIKDSSISFAYTPIDTDDDFNGYFVFNGDDVIEYLNWKGADANDMLKAFNDFEKAVKKYTSKEDAKIIIKDFHDKLGI